MSVFNLTRMKGFSILGSLCVLILCMMSYHVWGQDKVRIKTENGVLVIMNPEKPSSPPGSPKQMRITKELVIGKLKKMRPGINISSGIRLPGSKLSL